jgi:hypothetical protein
MELPAARVAISTAVSAGRHRDDPFDDLGMGGELTELGDARPIDTVRVRTVSPATSRRHWRKRADPHLEPT